MAKNYFVEQATDPGPISRADKLKKQVEMANDAINLNKDAWVEKYGTFKSYYTNSKYSPSDFYDTLKQNGPELYTKQLQSHEKTLKQQAAEEENLNKDAAGRAQFIKSYADHNNRYSTLVNQLPTKYGGYTYGENLDPVKYVNNKILTEAKDRQSKGKEGGVGLWYDSKDPNVCINGVCQVAQNSGVDFNGMKGLQNVLYDEKNKRYTPVNNDQWAQNIERTGYVEVPDNEKPQPGDFVQYSHKSGEHTYDPFHMEIVTGNKDGYYTTFNNYGLYNDGKGESWFEDNRGKLNPNGTPMGNNRAEMTKIYRIKPETAQRAALNDPTYKSKSEGKKAFEGSEDYKSFNDSVKFLLDNKNTQILGDDQPLMNDIVKGLGSQSADEMKKALLGKSKNPKLVEKVINSLYGQK